MRGDIEGDNNDDDDFVDTVQRKRKRTPLSLGQNEALSTVPITTIEEKSFEV